MILNSSTMVELQLDWKALELLSLRFNVWAEIEAQTWILQSSEPFGLKFYSNLESLFNRLCMTQWIRQRPFWTSMDLFNGTCLTGALVRDPTLIVRFYELSPWSSTMLNSEVLNQSAYQPVR